MNFPFLSFDVYDCEYVEWFLQLQDDIQDRLFFLLVLQVHSWDKIYDYLYINFYNDKKKINSLATILKITHLNQLFIQYFMTNKKEDKETKEEKKIRDSMVKLFLEDDDFDIYIKERIRENRRSKNKNKKK